jgi:GNAT superfamily N-acetyltransferase
MKIRQANVLDVPVLVGMWAAMVTELYNKEPEAFDAAKFFYTLTIRLFDAVQAEKNMALIAEDETGQAIGCVLGQDGDDTRRKVFFENMYIRPDHRCKGLAPKMITMILEWGRKRGAKACEIMVRRDVVRFYDKLGFKEDLVKMTREIDDGFISFLGRERKSVP